MPISLIRYLVQDDPQQSSLASSFIEKNCTAKTPGYLCHIVLCEMVWVLESNYQQSKDAIVRIIEQLLQAAQLELQEPEIVWSTLKSYQKTQLATLQAKIQI